MVNIGRRNRLGELSCEPPESLLQKQEATDNLRAAGVYLNRLSDYFFVLARTLMSSTEEPQWRGPQENSLVISRGIPEQSSYKANRLMSPSI